jgi:hypothetical protein
VASAFACGPFLPATLFWFEIHPDAPLKNFAAGEPGVINPGWYDSFQVVNWRILENKPLSSSEQGAFVAAWETELAGVENWIGAIEGQNAWEEERKKLGEPPVVYAWRSTEDYSSYQNCTDDAFRVAAEVLKNLKADVERDFWVVNQDRVFEACSNSGAPEPLLAPPGASRWLSQEALYQRAAWSFYQQKWEEASERFQKIAASKSPKRELAALLVARIEVRKLSLAELTEEARAQQIARARASLDAVVADPSLESVWASATRLRGFVDFHSQDPLRYRVVLAEALQNGKATRDRVRDFSLLMDRTLEQPSDNALIEWIRVYHRGLSGGGYARKRWSETHALVWLLAALDMTLPDTVEWPELAASARAAEGTKLHSTAEYLLLRGEVRRGELEAARLRAKKLLGQSLPLSSKNRILEVAAEVAEDLPAWLERVQVKPVAWGYLDGGTEWLESPEKPIPMVLSQAGALGLGLRMPLATLIGALSSLHGDIWPKALVAAFARAVVLGEDEAIKKLVVPAGEVHALFKDITPALLGAPTAAERRFVAALVLLRLPGSRYLPDAGVGRETELDEIDDYRDNWWCRMEKAPAPLPFLSEAEKSTLAKEQSLLLAAGSGPQALGSIVLEWAKQHSDDLRAAEALHRVVRGTRFSCGGNGEISKKAFALLHKQWPQSEWASKTPYWFD